jgi:hypothetical protein
VPADWDDVNGTDAVSTNADGIDASGTDAAATDADGSGGGAGVRHEESAASMITAARRLRMAGLQGIDFGRNQRPA